MIDTGPKLIAIGALLLALGTVMRACDELVHYDAEKHLITIGRIK